MKNWKQIVIFGSLGASVFLLLTGRKPAAGVLAGVSLAALASEYPEKVDRLWDRAPEYISRANQVLGIAATFLERLTEHRALRRDSPYVI